MSRFICIRIPHFAAWAAVRADAALRGKPVLVHDRGRVQAASPAALKLGVEIDCTVRRAEAMWPTCTAIPHHIPTTMAVWEEVQQAFYGLTPCLESIYPGQLMAEVRPPSAVEPLIKRWRAHGGVAEDRITAELAAIQSEPGTLLDIPANETEGFLRHYPVTALNEIGVIPDVIERLGWFGWNTLEHLRPLAKRQLLAQFEQGALLYRYAQAGDTRPVPPYREPPVIETTFEFEEPAHQPWEVEPVLDWLEREAREQLDQRVACSVTVTLLTQKGTLRHSRLLRDPSAQVYPLRQAAYGCLQELFCSQEDAASQEAAVHAREAPPTLTIVRMALRLAHLRQAPAIQSELFEPARPSVQKALRMIERRYPGTMRRIVTLDANAYLPEEAFRLDKIEIEEIADTRKAQVAPKILTAKGDSARDMPQFTKPASRSKPKRRSASTAGVPKAGMPKPGTATKSGPSKLAAPQQGSLALVMAP